MPAAVSAAAGSSPHGEHASVLGRPAPRLSRGAALTSDEVLEACWASAERRGGGARLPGGWAEAGALQAEHVAMMQ